MSDTLHPSEIPHRRFNPLSNSYVLVSPHRTKRPWAGQVDPPNVQTLPKWEKACYLCPGNRRMNGESNPEFDGTLIFGNDFPALLAAEDSFPETGTEGRQSPADTKVDLFQKEPTFGTCKVLTYSPRHDLTLALMCVPEIVDVVKCWTEVYTTESKVIRDGWQNVDGRAGEVGCVNIFENRGSMMGASAPHPHGQVWTTSFVPEAPQTELSSLVQYQKAHSSACLLCDYAKQEVEAKNGERVVVLDEESGWVALVPWWAVWPFEIMVLPYKRHITDLTAMTEPETAGLARVLKKVLTRYDNLFSTPFPYTMGIHQAPLKPLTDDHAAHFHMHFYPPLLRSSSVRKFLVGFEMLAEAQRDLTPEQAAARLRDLSEVHYTETLKAEAA